MANRKLPDFTYGSEKKGHVYDRSARLRLLLCVSLAAGCGAPEDLSADKETFELRKARPGVVVLDQGWDEATRASFYQTTQGSRMLPYDWFLHLEQPHRAVKFRAPSNMRRMGALVDKRTSWNPDRLPVGFARDEDPVRGDAIGLTCAACHTGELRYAGRRLRIDGGQSFLDLEAFQDGLLASLEATIDSKHKARRFCRNVVGKRASDAECADLRDELMHYRDWWAARIERSRGIAPHGPGRTDAFTIIGNEVTCVLLGVEENCIPAVAPVDFPYLWNTPDFDWVQYNSSAHNPLGRNVGEVTGVFAEQRLAADGSVDTSADVDNLYQLEEWIKELRAPEWPEAILGAIDQDLAARGEELYAENCASCHPTQAPRTAPNAYGVTFAQVDFTTTLAELGTDPTAAYSFATRRSDPGPWAPVVGSYGLLGPDGKAAAATLIALTTQFVMQKFFVTEGFTPPQMLAYIGFRESLTPSTQQLTTYKARPLSGVAFTAPFLHNGSVPSIYELLLPPDERSQQFWVGHTKYDPVRLGFQQRRTRGAVRFDTTVLGNGNGGHTYGTQLADAERMALIEFVKTL